MWESNYRTRFLYQEIPRKCFQLLCSKNIWRSSEKCFFSVLGATDKVNGCNFRELHKLKHKTNLVEWQLLPQLLQYYNQCIRFPSFSNAFTEPIRSVCIAIKQYCEEILENPKLHRWITVEIETLLVIIEGFFRKNRYEESLQTLLKSICFRLTKPP
jgi:hypothetical protein